LFLSLLATKAQNLTSVRNAATTIQNVVAEQESHRAYCAEWGISSEDLDDAPEATACTAYGAYLIDVGVRGQQSCGYHSRIVLITCTGDYTTLLMALAACLLGYGEVGLWLQAESRKPDTWVVREGNPYLKWMDEYAGENYQTAVKVGIRQSLIIGCVTFCSCQLQRLLRRVLWPTHHQRLHWSNGERYGDDALSLRNHSGIWD
jgi:hydroxymethylpyrimidine/phosphomethylpyrimidine kinase